MKQFILSDPPDSAGLVHLCGGDFHYLVRVRRLRPGAAFDARLPGGEPVRLQVVSLTDTTLVARRLAGEASSFPDFLPPIILFQALPKGAKMDLIVRQAAEGGLTEIAPFVSAYSVPRPGENDRRLERWRRIIREARQQSGSGIATAVREVRTLDSLLEYWRDLQTRYERPAGLLFHQTPLEQGSFHGYLDKRPDLVVLAVGPEGGFSPEEAVLCVTAGFKPLTMGNTILRTETAALYASAAIRIILLESDLWMPKVPL
jgi:16S rRNA (uracil1498-N3)-methyltransferase